MNDSPILSFWTLLAQVDAPAPDPSPLALTGPLLPFIMIGFLFYFLMIRPERRKRAEMAEMQANLKKNDRVLTATGISGVVVNMQKGSEFITIRGESPETKLRILRGAITRVLTDDDAGEKNAAG